MKKSRRLIRSTLVALGALMVLYVGANRLYAVGETQTRRQPVTAAELAELRGFSAVRVSGNLDVDIVQQADPAVELMSSSGEPPRLFASVHEDTLNLSGMDNPQGGRVRVGMPMLSQVFANEGAAVTVSGFTGEGVSIRLGGAREVILRNNAIRRWSIAGGDLREVQIDRATIGAGTVEVMGRATLRVID